MANVSEQPGASTSSQKTLEITSGGKVNKMRSHRGNIPVLPQTKLCHLCPAKFTRITHLNRHLRTHTNERLHICDKCHSQFTRSDLLSRHKRSCTTMLGIQRSRRKSCQACAESKVKCDLQRPCTKCKARDRECVYIVDLVTTAPGVDQSSIISSSPEVPSVEQLNAALPMLSLKSEQPPPLSSSLDYINLDALSAGLNTSSHSNYSERWSQDYPTGSSVASVSGTEYSTEGEIYPSLGPEGLTVQSQLNDLFSTEMIDIFYGYRPPPSNDSQNVASSQSTDMEYGAYFPDVDFLFSTLGVAGDIDPQPFMASVDFLEPEKPAERSLVSPPRSTIDGSPMVQTVQNAQPSDTERQHYLTLFFSAFLTQMPLVHVPTFHLVHKSSLLVSAMEVCGALYMKTPVAWNFLNITLKSSQESLAVEMSKNVSGWEENYGLILAIVLFQTIGLFHQRPEQRATSSMYHGMLIMWIRQCNFLKAISKWEPDLISEDPESIGVAWRHWAIVLYLSYLHDCCHCIYFGIRPTYAWDEFDLCLPCDDPLWKASTAEEWMREVRLCGVPGSRLDRTQFDGPHLQTVLSRSADVSRMGSTPLVLTPYGHFIVIHAILRKLCQDCLDSSQLLNNHTDSSNPSYPSAYPDVNSAKNQEKVYVIQCMLHNWLQSWLHSPNTPRPSPDPKDKEPIFFHNALPFYWVAQVSLLAYQEGLPPFGPGSGLGISSEAKFCLMKEWLKRIRGFLRQGEQAPTRFWDELTKIRIRRWQEEQAEVGSVISDDSDGLLGFFP